MRVFAGLAWVLAWLLASDPLPAVADLVLALKVILEAPGIL